MHKLLLTTALAAWAGMAGAQDLALVLGTERYDTLRNLPRGDEPVAEAEHLEDMGFEVVALRDANSAAIGRALERFAERALGAERIVVVLSGRFVSDGDRTWYLTRDTRGPSFLTLDETAVSVDSIMDVLARAPGSAILILSQNYSADAVFDPWLTEGVGDLDIPQGVTVLRGEPRQVASFMADELVRPEADLTRLIAADRAINVEGFLPRRFVFMGPAPERFSGVDPDGQVVVVPRPNTAAERALWDGAVALDTEASYRNYLRRHPEGIFAEEARNRIEAILAEPNREARLAEESLQLNREQRRGIQRNLNTLNYNTRGVDGIFGPGTRNAILNWQQQNGYAQTTYLTAEQISRLAGQARLREQEIAEEREQAELEARRAENAYWEATGATGTVAGLRAYLDRYPEGRYAGLATQRIAEADTRREEQARAEEQTVWDSMRTLGDIAAYENYLSLYPNGRFAAQARERLAELRTARDRESGGVQGIEGRFADAERALGLNNLTRRLVETHLQALGMNPGAADGEFDEQARMAIRRYQNERGLQVTGYLDARTAAMMLGEAQ